MDKNVNELITELNSTMAISQDMTVVEHCTLIVQPPDKLIGKLLYFINELRSIEPEHLYYLKNNLHLTLFSLIPKDLDTKKLASFIKQLLPKVPVSFHMQGVSRTGATAQPAGFSLQQLRSRLDEFCQTENYSKKPTSMQLMTWAILLRYVHEPSSEFLDFIDKNRKFDFGSFVPDRLLLYRTSNKMLDLTKPPEQIISLK